MSELPNVVERFLRYVAYDTQSAEDVETYPSTEKQKELGKLLVAELRQLGIADAAMDEYGYVMATVPANVEGAPVIGLMAHLDTSPEVSGANVKALLHRNYNGQAIQLAGEVVLSPEQSPQLLDHIGHTIITSDGNTLLGADDKAGVAGIMALVERLQTNPSIPRPRLRIGFTCDEEVGTGTKYFDVKKFGAAYAYTIDGETVGEIENETFCADAATLTVSGVNVHPGYAKDKLVNAIKAAAYFVELLPKNMTPECTEAREGYIHPVSIGGGVEKAVVKLILRDFEETGLKKQRQLLEDIVARVRAAFPRARVELVCEESYRNMRFVIDKHPAIIDYALEAVKRAGLQPKLASIRGGTDGAKLSFMGLPTPNIFAGGHLFHSRFEWVAAEDLCAVVDTLEQLVRIWSEKKK